LCSRPLARFKAAAPNFAWIWSATASSWLRFCRSGSSNSVLCTFAALSKPLTPTPSRMMPRYSDPVGAFGAFAGLMTEGRRRKLFLYEMFPCVVLNLVA